jgi:hypothetical protein
MENAILVKHKDHSPPTTHARNTNRIPIDGIWVSKGINPIAAGFLALDDACPSDHVALWVDFRKSDLLGSHTAPLQLNINKLKTGDPRLVSKYNQQWNKELGKHRIKQRLVTLATIS